MSVRKIAETILNGIFPKSWLSLSPGLAARLKASPLCLIDVGGAMGPEARWESLRPDFVRVMSFEPDARSLEGMDGNPQDIIVPIGLGAKLGRQTLYLTAGPFASSLYQPNAPVLRDFAVMPWYEAAGEIEIEVDMLAAVIARYPGWRADFIKVDVEGADLDVLKGAGQYLDQALGVQVEVSVVDRNNGAPLQPEVDIWLRDRGFIPFQFTREHWVRKSGLHGATSQPQLAWADAVYFRGRDTVLKRMRALGDDPAEELAHMLGILLAYELHDYAMELVDAARAEMLIDAATADDFRSSIMGSVVGLGNYAFRGLAAFGLACLAGIPLSLLGRRSRNLGGALIRMQAAPLFDALSRAARRSGLQRGCLTDL